MDRSERKSICEGPMWIIPCGLGLALVAGGVWIGIDRGEAKLARMVANDSPSVGSSKPFAVSTHETN